MLDKLLKVHKLTPFGRSGAQTKPAPTPAASQEPEDSPSVLKIVHAGGKVECYYMAIPAVKILEKYPSFVLAKPEVFRRPWDSVVRPEKILTPGHRLFLVPLRTVHKLRRRIKKPREDDVSAASSACRKASGIKKHVTFVGVDVKHKASGSCNSEKKGKSRRGNEKNSKSEPGGGRRIVNAIAWRPSLHAITESRRLRD